MQLRVRLLERLNLGIGGSRRRDEEISDEFQKYKIQMMLIMSVIPHINTQQHQQYDREGETPAGEHLTIGHGE